MLKTTYGVIIMNKSIIIPDTCVILNRPRILHRLVATESVNKILIPDVVVYELNYQKDHGKKQQAWFAMVSIEKLCKEHADRISVLHEERVEGINDQKIIFAASQVARRNTGSKVYLLTDDVLFSLAVKSTDNFEVLNLQSFEEKFPVCMDNFDKVASMQFFAAVKAGNLNKARMNLVKGVDPNFVDPSTGYTPLIQAVRNRSVPMVEFLAGLSGINCNLCDEAKYRLPAISHAVQLGDRNLVECLVRMGTDIDSLSQGRNHSNTALMISAWHGKTDLVRYLCELDACVNQQDSNGFTALIKACIKERVNCAKILYPITDNRIRSHEGLTAKDYALRTKNQELLSIFGKEEV